MGNTGYFLGGVPKLDEPSEAKDFQEKAEDALVDRSSLLVALASFTTHREVAEKALRDLEHTRMHLEDMLSHLAR